MSNLERIRLERTSQGTLSATLSNIEDCIELAKLYYSTGFVKKGFGGFNSSEEFALALFEGSMMGLNIPQIRKWLYVINNQLAVYGAGTFFLIRRHPQCAKLHIQIHGNWKDDDYKVVGKTLMKGEQEWEPEITFTKQDAIDANLFPFVHPNTGLAFKIKDSIGSGQNKKYLFAEIKQMRIKFDPELYEKLRKAAAIYQDAWCNYPNDLMMGKVASRIVKIVYPDATSGLPVYEDLVGTNELYNEIAPDTEETGASVIVEDVSTEFKALKEALPDDALEQAQNLYQQAQSRNLKEQIAAFIEEKKEAKEIKEKVVVKAEKKPENKQEYKEAKEQEAKGVEASTDQKDLDDRKEKIIAHKLTSKLFPDLTKEQIQAFDLNTFDKFVDKWKERQSAYKGMVKLTLPKKILEFEKYKKQHPDPKDHGWMEKALS